MSHPQITSTCIYDMSSHTHFTVKVGQIAHHSTTFGAAVMLVIFHCTNNSAVTLHTSTKQSRRCLKHFTQDKITQASKLSEETSRVHQHIRAC